MHEKYAIEWPQNTVTDMSTPAAIAAEVKTVMAAATDVNINLICGVCDRQSNYLNCNLEQSLLYISSTIIKLNGDMQKYSCHTRFNPTPQFTPEILNGWIVISSLNVW